MTQVGIKSSWKRPLIFAGGILAVFVLVAVGLSIGDDRSDPEPVRQETQDRTRQSQPPPCGQMSEGSTSENDTYIDSDESARSDYLRLASFPKDANHDWLVVLPEGSVSSDSSREIRLRKLREGPVKVTIVTPIPKRLPFELEHYTMHGTIYSGHTTPSIDDDKRYWDITVPDATVEIVVESTEATGTARATFVVERPQGGRYSWGGIEFSLVPGAAYSASLVPWKYEIETEGWYTIDEPEPPADRPSKIVTYFDVAPNTVDLRTHGEAQVSLRVRRADAWRPVNTFGRSIRVVYAFDGGGWGPMFAFYPDEPRRVWLGQTTPPEGEDYDPSEWSVVDNWKYDASGGLWFQEPESLERPAIAVIEFDDGGVSVVRRTAPLGLSVRELVVTGTPDDGERIEFVMSAPSGVTIRDIEVRCEVRMPYLKADDFDYYSYTKFTNVSLESVTTIAIPFGAELLISDIRLPRGVKLEIVSPEDPNDYKDRSNYDRANYWGPPLRVGDRMTIKLAERSE